MKAMIPGTFPPPLMTPFLSTVAPRLAMFACKGRMSWMRYRP